MQRTTADGCLLVGGSLDLGETTSLHDFVIGVEPVNQSSPFASLSKIVFLQMSWQPQDMVIVSNEENMQFDTGE